jgi:hypothetical protein
MIVATPGALQDYDTVEISAEGFSAEGQPRRHPAVGHHGRSDAIKVVDELPSQELVHFK